MVCDITYCTIYIKRQIKPDIRHYDGLDIWVVFGEEGKCSYC